MDKPFVFPNTARVSEQTKSPEAMAAEAELLRLSVARVLALLQNYLPVSAIEA